MELIKKKSKTVRHASPTDNTQIVTGSNKKMLLVKGNIGKVGIAYGTARHTERRKQASISPKVKKVTVAHGDDKSTLPVKITKVDAALDVRSFDYQS